MEKGLEEKHRFVSPNAPSSTSVYIEFRPLCVATVEHVHVECNPIDNGS